jgi:hypothetical protein
MKGDLNFRIFEDARRFHNCIQHLLRTNRWEWINRINHILLLFLSTGFIKTKFQKHHYKHYTFYKYYLPIKQINSTMAPFSMKNLVCVVATLSMAHSHVQLVEGKKVSNTINTLSFGADEHVYLSHTVLHCAKNTTFCFVSITIDS